jgi:hypothetical protein
MQLPTVEVQNSQITICLARSLVANSPNYPVMERGLGSSTCRNLLYQRIESTLWSSLEAHGNEILGRPNPLLTQEFFFTTGHSVRAPLIVVRVIDLVFQRQSIYYNYRGSDIDIDCSWYASPSLPDESPFCSRNRFENCSCFESLIRSALRRKWEHFLVTMSL